MIVVVTTQENVVGIFATIEEAQNRLNKKYERFTYYYLDSKEYDVAPTKPWTSFLHALFKVSTTDCKFISDYCQNKQCFLCPLQLIPDCKAVLQELTENS